MLLLIIRRSYADAGAEPARPAITFKSLFQGLLAAVCLSTSLCAQQEIEDKRLVLTVVPTHEIVRGHAPVSLTASLTWHAAELIEGGLQLDWYADTTKLGRTVIPHLALANSSLELPVMLPPVVLASEDTICTVQGKFITPEAVYDLEEHDVAVQPDWRRVLLVGVCREAQPLITSRVQMLAMERKMDLPHSFYLEPFFRDRFRRRELVVDHVDVDPSKVPTDPLRMTAFDLFVIPGESLAGLKPAQLECLLQWVRAGGSLCVIADSAVPQSHVDWLNRLAGRDAADAAYLRNAEGHLVPTEPTSQSLHRHFVSLGRSVITLAPPELESDGWKQAVLFLWKVRADRVKEFVQAGALKQDFVDEAVLRRVIPAMRANLRREMALKLGPQRVWTSSEVSKLLLPESVRGLPLGTVSLILVLFLLAIAPGDYLLLGRLRQRRWTWVLFPALSLAFTWYTMWTARQHLGRASYDRSMTVIDVGEDGLAVRKSQIQVLFADSNRQVLTEKQSSLMVPLDPFPSRAQQRQFEPETFRLYEQPWTYTGRMPRSYTVSRDLQQWAPRLARTTQIGPGEVDSLVSGIDWDLLDAGDLRGLVSVGPVYTLRMTSAGAIPLIPAPTFIPLEVIDLASRITHRPPSGLFSLVSSISPTGSGNWEDLTLLDASDPEQEVLVVITNPSDGHYVIVRQLKVAE